MFHLDRAIEGWLAEVVPGGCGHQDQADELEDHLRSEVDALRRRGFSEQVAFYAATRRLGSTSALARELKRSRGTFARLCELGGGREETSTTDRRRLEIRVAVLVVATSIAWAGVMMATSAALSGTDRYEQVSDWLLAGWWITTMLPLALLDLRGSARAELQCLRGKVRGLRS